MVLILCLPELAVTRTYTPGHTVSSADDAIPTAHGPHATWPQSLSRRADCASGREFGPFVSHTFTRMEAVRA